MAESRRGAKRRLNMMSQRVNFDVECPSSPEKMATDEMSFYSGNSPAASPQPCSISPTCMEMSLLSPENSPCHFTAIQDDSEIQIVRRRKLTVDDYESSSRDSGYSTSIGMEGVVAHNNHHHHHHQHNRNSTQENSGNNKIEFKFVEPCGTAPRRLEPSPPRTMTTTMTNQTTAITTKTVSMNDAMIMTALAKSAETELIGDFSKPYCLPLMDGRHQDLKSISVHTMAKLLRGEFWNNVSSFKVIDCRYPYEYEGGHIQGADNLYTKEQILESLVSCKLNSATVEPSEMPKRNILVFHCEFSSERGPKLSRFLRNLDRSRNENSYPALHYPEIYLLNGGYKDFFESYAEFCTPNSYRPMLHPSFIDSYRHFRAKSKSWNGDSKKSSGSMNRLTKSRSRLVL